ncbi:MAG: hypothetical protein Q7T51_00460 [Candidatus Moranbacteria bacterium]|nr:hypothetical protein [Candidatus Moranbacteria bacterium]
MLAQNWMLIAFVAPMSWALVVMIDRWLATDQFKEEDEVVAVIGFFGILPLMSMFVWGLPKVNILYGSLAVGSGILFMIYTFFYFRSLFKSDDTVLISILMNMPGLVVPLLAAWLVHERLSGVEYFGIVVVVTGSVIACFEGKVVHDKLKCIAWPMAIAIITFSLSMVVDEQVYNKISFYDGFMFFSVGIFLSGCFCYTKKSIREKRLFRVKTSSYLWLVVAECFNLIAIVFSHYAIKVSPAVSYVAVIETTVPAFVLIVCGLIYWFCRTFNISIDSKHADVLQSQFVGLGNKSLAIAIMAFGIYLLG